MFAGQHAGAKCMTCAPSAARACVHEHAVRHALQIPGKGARHSRSHMAKYQNIMHEFISPSGDGLRLRGRSRVPIAVSDQQCAVVCGQVQGLLEADVDSDGSCDSSDEEGFWQTCGQDVCDVHVVCPDEQLDYDALRACIPQVWQLVQRPLWIPEATEDQLWLGTLSQVWQQCDSMRIAWRGIAL